ncbi:hypothetical protein EAF00_000155 [Botryotinia globosa]|nr:hypothetical protein EAF00_000155 [Botryotinia globosa]
MRYSDLGLGTARLGVSEVGDAGASENVTQSRSVTRRRILRRGKRAEPRGLVCGGHSAGN